MFLKIKHKRRRITEEQTTIIQFWKEECRINVLYLIDLRKLYPKLKFNKNENQTKLIRRSSKSEEIPVSESSKNGSKVGSTTNINVWKMIERS